VLLGTDGAPRVLDFGVAKAAGRVQTTREGQIKGKLSYMPPEQLRGASVDRKTDIYAVGVMLWELITGQRLFAGDNEGVVVAKVLEGRIEPPSQVVLRGHRVAMGEVTMHQLQALDQTILRALSMDPAARHSTAREMAIEVERRMPPATASECADWLESTARDVLASRAALIAEIESSASHTVDESHILSVLNAKATLGPSNAPLPRPASSHELVARPSSPVFASTMPLSQQNAMQMQLPMPHAHHYPMAIEGPPVTQPSSISVSSHSMAQHEPSRGPRNAIAAMIGVFLGAAVLGGALWWNHRRATVLPLAAEPSAAAATLAAPPPPPSSSAVVVAPPPTAEMVEEAHDAGPSKPPVKTVTNPSPKPPSGGRAAAPPPAPQPATKPDECATPYWYDASGVKHYKPQCLGKP
jgi:serine/threonine-protein kinase